MPLRSRILLYGSVIGIVLLVVTADLWASSSPLAALLFFAVLGASGTCSTAAGRSRGGITTEAQLLCGLQPRGTSATPPGGASNPPGPKTAMPRRVSLRLVHCSWSRACASCPPPRRKPRRPRTTCRRRRIPARSAGRRSRSRRTSSCRPATGATPRQGPRTPIRCLPVPARPGFRSMWYTVEVPEAAVLRVTRDLDRPGALSAGREHPDPGTEEVACGLANDVKQGSTANATAYVSPGTEGKPRPTCVRVAEVANNSPRAPACRS